MSHDNDGKHSSPSWGRLQEDLKSALDNWTELSAKARARKSPEEMQLDEIRRLLGDLQSKIQHFEEDAPPQKD
ncbi:MAG TPA: hypothetical protein PL182_13325 [Pseudobdellovibrionaceae bacterium]|nr:hypothetical protein [Pseudobdellovibrionaceae bacterium]